MTLTQLEYVLAVNKYRHFGKAAKSCHITQPTLSMQLQKLEDELEVIIFDRSKNPILPTPEGLLIINQAQIVIKENNKIFDLLDNYKGDLRGTFKLAVIPTLAPYLIPLFVKKFTNAYPSVELIIEEYKTEDIIEMLKNDQLDAGLLVTPLHDEMIIERVLYFEPFYLFIDPKHPLNKKNKVSQDDLDLKEIWMLNKGNCFRDQVLNICRESLKRKDENDSLRFESGNFETLKNMVLKHSGYTLLPHMAVTALSSQRKKMIKEFVKPTPIREVSLIHCRSFLKERTIDAIEKTIISSIPKELKTLKGDNSIIEIY